MWKSESFVTDGATEKALKFLKPISQHKVRQTHTILQIDDLNLNHV